MFSLHIYYKSIWVVLSLAGTALPNLFSWGLRMSKSSLTPFARPQRMERHRQWCKGTLSCYLKIEQFLMLKNMVWKYSLGSHTTQPTGKARGPMSRVMTWWPSLLVFAQLWGNKDAGKAVQQARAMAVPCQGQGWEKHKQNLRWFQHVWCWKHSLVTYSWKDSKWLHKANSRQLKEVLCSIDKEGTGKKRMTCNFPSEAWREAFDSMSFQGWCLLECCQKEKALGGCVCVCVKVRQKWKTLELWALCGTKCRTLSALVAL